MTTPQVRAALVQHFVVTQEAVASRHELLQAGLPRWYLRNELRQRRWQRGGRQTLVLHNGPLQVVALRWIAVLEVGRPAALDGVTALQAAGLEGLDDVVIHVATPRGSTPFKPTGVVVHETRRFREEDVVAVGVRRVRPAVAAVHAALWAATDRQARLFVLMTAQQRLASLRELEEALAHVLRHRRRRLLRALLAELAAGVTSLNELEVAEALRARGLPEPTRQTIRRRPTGVQYLDAEFEEYDVVLEVDGAGHDRAANKLGDLLRDLDLITEGRTVIRIAVEAWALDRGAVLDGLERVFRTRGWRTAA